VPARHLPPARPLNTLPPTLTDAQLAHLDVLTREAIDERLRVLEGVSSTMYRCMEELTRLRSVLPVAAGPAPPATPTGSRPEQGSTTQTQTQTAVNGSENAPDLRPLDPDLKLDVPSSDAKSGTDVNGASSSSETTSVVANGDTVDAPTTTN
jgi:E3 ubiquitin-protein ligase synoviolin